MTAKPPEYPDISDIYARKIAGRRAMAALSFEEKLDILDRMREAAAPIIASRQREAPQGRLQRRPVRQQGKRLT